jgi:hypothetical protein
MIARWLYRLPIHDCTNGFRAIRTRLLTSLAMRENSFSVIMEELYHLKHLTDNFTEIPVVLTARTAEQRGTAFQYKPAVFCRYLKYPLKSLLVRGPRPLKT